MGAPNKDTVYAALREKGIRAIKVTERIQPVIRTGFAGLRKRDISCIVALALVLSAGVWFFAVTGRSPARPADDSRDQDVLSADSSSGNRTDGQPITSKVVQLAQPRPRKWLVLPNGFNPTNVFTHPHEVYLARYALPGVDPRSAFAASFAELPVQDFYDNLNAGIIIDADDDPSVAELKRIVTGMKEDAKKYLMMPDGIEKLGTWLEERQTMEAGYREQYAQRVLRGELTKDDVNAIFSAMGLELIK